MVAEHLVLAVMAGAVRGGAETDSSRPGGARAAGAGLPEHLCGSAGPAGLRVCAEVHGPGRHVHVQAVRAGSGPWRLQHPARAALHTLSTQSAYSYEGSETLEARAAERCS